MAFDIARRQFIAAVGGAAVSWPITARAQQPDKIPHIGLLSPFAAIDTAQWYRAFLQGLRDLGWVDGKNIVLEYRYADGKSERLPDLVGDFVQRKVDVIVTSVSNDSLAAKNATTKIPIVIAEAEPHVDCLCGSVWPLSSAVSACRRHMGRVQSRPASSLSRQFGYCRTCRTLRTCSVLSAICGTTENRKVRRRRTAGAKNGQNERKMVRN
jgi:hypothetical protein